jgi:hypothetical protein
MARYELLQKAFIDMRVLEVGEQITVADDVIPGPYMKPLDKPALVAFKAYAAAGYRAPVRNIEDMQFASFEGFDLSTLKLEDGHAR